MPPEPNGALGAPNVPQGFGPLHVVAKVTPPIAGSFATVAVNTRVVAILRSRVAGLGATDTVGGMTVTVAVRG